MWHEINMKAEIFIKWNYWTSEALSAAAHTSGCPQNSTVSKDVIIWAFEHVSLLFSEVILLACCPLDSSSIVVVCRELSPQPGRVGNQCRKCFNRRLCGSETAFGSWGTRGRGRFRGSQTDRFLLCRPLSPDRSPCFKRHTSIPDLSDWSVCPRESLAHCADHIFLFYRVTKDEISQDLSILILSTIKWNEYDEKPWQIWVSCTQCSTLAVFLLLDD